MQVVHALRAVHAVVYDHTEPLRTLRLADLGGGVHEVAKYVLLIVACEGELRESVAILGDEDDVRGRRGGDVAECEAEIVLVHLGRGDGAVDWGKGLGKGNHSSQGCSSLLVRSQ